MTAPAPKAFGVVEIHGDEVDHVLDVSLEVGVKVAGDAVVGGDDDRLGARRGELEQAVDDGLDRGDARQAGAKPEIRCEVRPKPRRLQRVRGVDP